MDDFSEQMSDYHCHNDTADMVFELLMVLLEKPQAKDTLQHCFNSVQGGFGSLACRAPLCRPVGRAHGRRCFSPSPSSTEQSLSTGSQVSSSPALPSLLRSFANGLVPRAQRPPGRGRLRVLRWASVPQLLWHCCSAIAEVRERATALLYLTMRRNFMDKESPGFSRIKVQATIALSRVCALAFP
jgi:hypothetical protein